MKTFAYLIISILLFGNCLASDCDKTLSKILQTHQNKEQYLYTKENKFILPHSISLNKTNELIGSTIEVDNFFSPYMKVFKGHFPGKGNAIFPGVLHFDTMIQTSRELLYGLNPNFSIRDFELISASKLKFSAPILPGDSTLTKVRLNKIIENNYEFMAEIIDPENQKVLSSATFILGKKESSQEFIQPFAGKKIYSKRKIKQFLPHREPFLFLDSIKGMTSLVNLNVDNFSKNKIVANYKAKNTNPVLSARQINFERVDFFHEPLQIEAMAQNAGVLISEYAQYYDIKNLKFLLASIDDFQSYQNIKASDELVIISKVSKPWKGSINKKAIVELEGEIYIKKGDRLVLASRSKSKAFIFPGEN